VSGHRKAALALHALASEDRDAVLAELPEADRHVLRAHLDELTALGFDPGAIDDVLADRPAAAPRERVDMADVADVLRVVGDEPVSFLAALLHAGPWRWEAALLGALPGHLRVRLEAQRAHESGDAPARAAFVVGAVAEALGRHGGDAGPRAGKGAVARLRKWIAPWTR
jgi:hypothetical protein